MRGEPLPASGCRYRENTSVGTALSCVTWCELPAKPGVTRACRTRHHASCAFGGNRCAHNGRVDPGEACDASAPFSNPWTCSTRCTSSTLYNGRFDDSQCMPGDNCYVGVCTHACGTGGSCPTLLSATGTTGRCVAGFACFAACRSTSNCAAGLVCTDGSCMGCQWAVQRPDLSALRSRPFGQRSLPLRNGLSREPRCSPRTG
jgi:hypothetical protein